MTDTLPKIPDLTAELLVTLRELGGSARVDEAVDHIAERLEISDEALDRTTNSGAKLFKNRVQWARLGLVRAGYVDSSRRGVWTLTELGKTVEIGADFGRRTARNVQNKYNEARASREAEIVDDDPADGTNDSFDRHDVLVLKTIKSMSPGAFERLCQRVLRESGFEQVVVTGRSHDGGIDGHGVLQINPFVSFQVLFQCKRYQGAVGSSAVRDFRGAMMGRADKGIILTTGTFSNEANREANRDGAPPIELVDGEGLVGLLEDLELGLRPKRAFDVDVEFFRSFED